MIRTWEEEFRVLVEIQLFAVARQLAQQPRLALEIPPGTTVGGLKRVLADFCPDLAPLLPHLMIAVNSQYARDDLPIPIGAEVAVIPPVSGG